MHARTKGGRVDLSDIGVNQDVLERTNRNVTWRYVNNEVREMLRQTGLNTVITIVE